MRWGGSIHGEFAHSSHEKAQRFLGARSRLGKGFHAEADKSDHES
jgi:hypothetical protein